MVPDALPDDRFQFRDPSILRRDDRAERRFGLAVVAGGFQPVPVFADFAAQGSSIWTLRVEDGFRLAGDALDGIATGAWKLRDEPFQRCLKRFKTIRRLDTGLP